MNRTDRELSVLYIDDEAGMQGFNSLVELLEDQGLRITSASNATGALKFLDESAQRFDAVLLDIIMPPFDCYTLEETEGGISTGWRLLEDIRRRQPTLPVVVVSVIQMKDVNGVRARYGVKRVLPKESPTQSIVAAVREAVSEVAKR